MLKEHVDIVKTLEGLENVVKKSRNQFAIDFARKLKLHDKTEEDLTYPAVLMVGKLLSQG